MVIRKRGFWIAFLIVGFRPMSIGSYKIGAKTDCLVIVPYSLI